MIRLIISDIDGTLVPEGGSCLNPEYIQVILALAEQGIVFAAASGRQASSIDAVFHSIRDHIYYLADNGAYVQRYGLPAREVRMCREDAEGLIRELRTIPGQRMLLSTREGYFMEDRDPGFFRLVTDEYKGKSQVVEDLLAYAPQCIKMSLYCPDGSRKIYDRLDEHWKKRFMINISGERWVDINAHEATKGNAVRWMQEQMGISPEETVVFGDNFNDITMMECAVRSYASVLSNPEVKRAARYEVASYEDDGVLQVLKQILEEKNSENKK